MPKKNINSPLKNKESSKIDYRQQSMMQQAIFDAANYSIISTAIDGTIMFVNDATSRMLGYSADELVGRHTPALFHDPQEIAQHAECLSIELGEAVKPGFEVFVAKAKRGIAEEREWTYINKDDRRIPVVLSVTALRDEANEINGFLGIAFDITEKTLIKRDLQEKEARYRLLFEKSGDSIFLLKGDYFVDCNPATLRMFACTREQIINQTPYRYSPEFQPDGRASKEKAIEKITAALNDQKKFFEWQHLKYDGTPFDAEVTLNAIEINGEPHILATVRDISDRKMAERELEKSKQQLLTRNESLWLINSLSTRLHGSHSFQTIANETLYALLGLTQTTHAAIYLIDEKNDLLRLTASHGFDQHVMQTGKTISLENSLSGYGLEKGEIIFSEDFEADERIQKNIKQALLAMGACSGVVVPLIYQGRKLGSINIIYKTRHDFTEIEKETLDVISNTVSLSLANAHQIAELEYMAHHDSLTGLSNRLLYHQIFQEKIADPSYKSSVLLLLDLNRFKEINDTLGHHIGDEMLQQIGPRLNSVFAGQRTLISRLGGDEFTILVDNVSDNDTIVHYAEDLLESLRQPFMVHSTKLEIDGSIGIAKYPEDGNDSHELLRSADVAMYEAKHKGGGFAIYDRAVDKHTPERLTLIAELNGAIRDNQLVLHYQPKINLTTNKVSSFEALVRWQHGSHGLLYPDKFIQLAEVNDTINNLTAAVLRIALQQLKDWHNAGHEFSVSVNLSARNLVDENFIIILQDMLRKYDIQQGMLELEITETALMQDPETAINLLNQISDLGVTLSIDDFGTGYSSLSYLRRMPINALKIDREFVTDMLSNDQDKIIVNSTIALAHNLKLSVVAEGVEDLDTMMQLKTMDCDYVQGYYISKPKPWSDIEVWLAQKK